jgi:hypothetical protein
MFEMHLFYKHTMEYTVDVSFIKKKENILLTSVIRYMSCMAQICFPEPIFM